MFKINKESDTYDVIANFLASVFGFAGSALVGAFCEAMISTNCNESGPFKRLFLKTGKFGLETITLYSVSKKMREEIDDLVDVINDVSGVVDEYNNKKLTEANESNNEIVYE